ncbi:hypothetical protein CJF30_00005563 [Rutstroemia sp. NJR-2017a BBW]|nr:hypothetical protein CJF30_00005820 [Rutstroemia sp. NJR-2017a BBW]PQE08732.1 hypothetical protein CJF30_00005563 [Rutstroemia sp. NJR-2017a BBW]
MPSFFAFQQGSERRTAFTNETAPLLGRFRAVPDLHRFSGGSGRSLLGFNVDRLGAAFGVGTSNNESEEDNSEDEGCDGVTKWGKTMKDLWLEPKQGAVARVVDKWWTRWTVLVVLPAALAVVPPRHRWRKKSHLVKRNVRLILYISRPSHGAHYHFRNMSSPTTKTMWETCRHTFLDIGYPVTEKPEFRSTFGSSCLYIMGSTI